MIVLGVHTGGHDTGACLFDDDTLIFSIETERLTRVKHDRNVQVALDHLFQMSGIRPDQVSRIALSTSIHNSVAKLRDCDSIRDRIRSGVLHVESDCELLGWRAMRSSRTRSVPRGAGMSLWGWEDQPHHRERRVRNLSHNNVYLSLWVLSLVNRDGLPWYHGLGYSATAYCLGFEKRRRRRHAMALGACSAGSETKDVFYAVPSDLHVMEPETQTS